MEVARILAVGSIAVAVFFGTLAGCEKKKEGLSEAECSSLRSEGYKLVNDGKDKAGHGCDPKLNNTDCAETSWPECGKPVNTKNLELIKELQKKFEDGKCKDTAATCKDTPPVFCKEGLCAMRFAGTPAP